MYRSSPFANGPMLKEYVVSGVGLTPVDVDTSDTLSIAECSNTLITNYGQVNDIDIVIPSVENLHFVLMIVDPTLFYFRVHPIAGGILALNGESNGANKYIQNAIHVDIPGTVKYATIEFYTAQTGPVTIEWQAFTRSGLWLLQD